MYRHRRAVALSRARTCCRCSVVGTSFAVEGVTETGVVPGVVRAESADEWIATLLEDDDASWRERSRAAADFINRSFSAQRQRDDLARALRWVG